ncbi:MAG TPA: maleate cis-trans isomerase [Sneathiellales bacterium]|jgi:maleate isomerase|nr:maleate cis-trans isomerase [Sneathiellales bacterium]
MLQPDGRATKARIGVLVPHMELVAESEFAAMAPAGVSIHAARVPLGPFGPHRETRPTDIREMVSAFAKPPDVDRAAAMLAAAPLNVIVFAFTSSSYLLGADADASLKTRLEENTGGIPVVIQCAAAVAALRAVGAQRPALVHPPWWPDVLDEWGVAYFRDQGFDVAGHGTAKLPSHQGEVDAVKLADWIAMHVPTQADSVFLGGSGLRTIGTIQELEAELCRPVITANQAAFWYAIGLAGVAVSSKSYGQLFDMDVP